MLVIEERDPMAEFRYGLIDQTPEANNFSSSKQEKCSVSVGLKKAYMSFIEFQKVKAILNFLQSENTQKTKLQ